MKIGYLYGFEAYPPRGGNHRHVVELVQGFLKASHSVLVVDDPTIPGVSSFEGSPSGITAFTGQIDVLYIRIDGRFIRQWGLLTACLSRVDTSVPIIWEINSPEDECLAFSWLGGDFSEDEGPIRRLRRWFHALRKRPNIFLEARYRKELAARVSSAICVSNSMGRYAFEDLKIKDVHVLPNGGPLITEEEIARRRKTRENDGFTVLYCGSAVYPWQGINYLTDVITLAGVEAPDMTFVLAVNQRSQTLPDGANVIIREGLSQDEVRDAICTADVCVAFPPDWPWTKHGFHGSPTKLFEYMACMTAVVTSELGQMKDLLRHREDGLLCKPGQEEILRELIFLRDNPEQREAIARGGWMRVQSELNWQRTASRTLEVLGEMAALSD